MGTPNSPWAGASRPRAGWDSATILGWVPVNRNARVAEEFSTSTRHRDRRRCQAAARRCRTRTTGNATPPPPAGLRGRVGRSLSAARSAGGIVIALEVSQHDRRAVGWERVIRRAARAHHQGGAGRSTVLGAQRAGRARRRDRGMLMRAQQPVSVWAMLCLPKSKTAVFRSALQEFLDAGDASGA